MATYIDFQPSDFFNTVLHTGNGSELAVSGVGFEPDFTWIKNRTNVDFHVLTDTVRGATKYVKSNDTTVETTNAEGLKSWQSDGYTLGTQNQVNENTADFSGWNWKAGTTSGIATDGSTTITPSSYSFNQTAGISIIKYTGNSTSGAQLAHGLGAKPSFWMLKSTDGAESWAVYHKNMSSTLVTTNTDFDTDAQDYYTHLNTQASRGDSTDWWHYTAPTSVNMYLGNQGQVNSSSLIYIAYVFSEKRGYSKFHGHKGNGSADGVFCYTGFRPAWLMIKRVDSGTEDWNMWDSKALGYNIDNNPLYANLTNAQGTSDEIDLVSNGFKIRTTNGGFNASGGTYIWAAFAELPIVSSNDVPAVAR